MPAGLKFISLSVNDPEFLEEILLTLGHEGKYNYFLLCQALGRSDNGSILLDDYKNPQSRKTKLLMSKLNCPDHNFFISLIDSLLELGQIDPEFKNDGILYLNDVDVCFDNLRHERISNNERQKRLRDKRKNEKSNALPSRDKRVTNTGVTVIKNTVTDSNGLDETILDGRGVEWSGIDGRGSDRAPDEKNSVAGDNTPVVVGCGRQFEQAQSSSEGEGEPEDEPICYGRHSERLPNNWNDMIDVERTRWKVDHFIFENGYVFYNMSIKMDLKELREIWKRYAKRLGERNAYSLFIKATMVFLKNSKIKKPDIPAAYFQDMLNFAEDGRLDYDNEYFQRINGTEMNQGEYIKS